MNVARIHFALAFDATAMLGAHVTMLTTLVHLAPHSRPTFHCYGPSFLPADIQSLRQTLDAAGRPYDIRYYEVSAARFSHLKWLGGYMTYVRLLIPTLSDVPRVVYIDSDLLVFADLAEIYYFPLDGHTLGAVSWHEAEKSNDRPCFLREQLPLGVPYLNAGVLLVDTARWRAQGAGEKCFQIANRYGKGLLTADQTVLNLLFRGEFALLPRRFNTPVWPHTPALRPSVYENRVVHLIGRPKPWDPLGRLNGQYRLFWEWAGRTDMAGRARGHTIAEYFRAMRFGIRYAKCIRARLFSFVERGRA